MEGNVHYLPHFSRRASVNQKKYMITKKITLDEFRLGELRLYPNATGELSSLLREIALAGKRIQAEINHSFGPAKPADELTINSSGETIKKLDQFANDELLHVLKNSFSCAGAVSEEGKGIYVFDNIQNNASQYLVMFDPADGSTDNCMTPGTIFGIYRRSSPAGQPCTENDFLQTGRNLAAAGYIIYGSPTMLVYATKRGVNGFTLDNTIGEFCLTHPNIRCPEQGSIYSVNDSKILQYPDPVIQFIKGMHEWNVHNPGSFTSRYAGSIVADLHRILFEGGIFLYPPTKENREGRLRLLYECNPFAFIFETAGGLASNGNQCILDIKPEKIHQRTPLFAGSRKMVRQMPRIYSINYSYYPDIKV